MADKTEKKGEGVSGILRDTLEKAKKNLKNKDLITDASYELGRSFKIAKNTCVEIFNDLME